MNHARRTCVSVCFDSEESFDPDGISLCVALEAEALDCRVLIPPEACNGLTPNPPCSGFDYSQSPY